MKIEEIQGLIKFVAKSGVSEVELEMDDVKLVIKTGSKEKASAPQIIQAAVPAAVTPTTSCTSCSANSACASCTCCC